MFVGGTLKCEGTTVWAKQGGVMAKAAGVWDRADEIVAESFNGLLRELKVPGTNGMNSRISVKAIISLSSCKLFSKDCNTASSTPVKKTGNSRKYLLSKSFCARVVGAWQLSGMAVGMGDNAMEK
jgi:hypothetical protein